MIELCLFYIRGRLCTRTVGEFKGEQVLCYFVVGIDAFITKLYKYGVQCTEPPKSLDSYAAPIVISDENSTPLRGRCEKLSLCNNKMQ